MRHVTTIPALFLTVGVFAYAGTVCSDLYGQQNSCNPYPQRLYKAKEIRYERDRKRLIVDKNVRKKPSKKKTKIITVEDLIERYKKIYPPVRYSVESHPVIEKQIKQTHRERTRAVPYAEKQQDINKTREKPLAEHNKALPKKKIGEYRVAPGDMLSKIAKKFNISTAEISRLNHIKPDALLHVGEVLKLPFGQRFIDAISSGQYTVQKGDTLLKIAHRFGLDAKEIATYNSLKNTQLVHIGTVLKLPLPYIIEKQKKLREQRLAQERAQKAKQERLKRKKLVEKRRKEMLARKQKKQRILRVYGKHRLRVTATAYTSHGAQTDSTPFLAAWNNRIRPGMKVIAVSRDLIRKYGLGNGAKVRIGGLPGVYTVRDKMNKRFRRRIDIYMGTDRRRALRWGKRSVVIYF